MTNLSDIRAKLIKEMDKAIDLKQFDIVETIARILLHISRT